MHYFIEKFKYILCVPLEIPSMRKGWFFKIIHYDIFMTELSYKLEIRDLDIDEWVDNWLNFVIRFTFGSAWKDIRIFVSNYNDCLIPLMPIFNIYLFHIVTHLALQYGFLNFICCEIFISILWNFPPVNCRFGNFWLKALHAQLIFQWGFYFHNKKWGFGVKTELCIFCGL